MDEALVRLLLLSLSGVLLGLLLFVLQPLLKKAVSRRILYGLWIVVLLRLVVPVGVVGIDSGILVPAAALPAAVTRPAPTQSAPTTAPTAAPISTPTSAAQTATPTPAAGGSTGGSGGSGLLAALATQASDAVDAGLAALRRVATPLAAGLLLLWAAGVIASLAVDRRRHVRLMRSLRTEARPATDEDLALLESCRADLGVRRTVALVRAPTAPTPFLTGVRRPVLCLPDRAYEPEELRLVFLHELVHVRHGDLLAKGFANLVVALHWFNPALRWIRRELSHAAELACDEAVSARLGREERTRYGTVLLRQASTAPWALHPGSQALSESGRRLRQRLRVIGQMDGSPRGRKMAGLVALLLLLVVPLPQFAPIALTGCAATPRTIPVIVATDAFWAYEQVLLRTRDPQPSSPIVLNGVVPLSMKAADASYATLDFYSFASDSQCAEGESEWKGKAPSDGRYRETFRKLNLFLVVTVESTKEVADAFFARSRSVMDRLVAIDPARWLDFGASKVVSLTISDPSGDSVPGLTVTDADGIRQVVDYLAGLHATVTQDRPGEIQYGRGYTIAFTMKRGTTRTFLLQGGIRLVESGRFFLDVPRSEGAAFDDIVGGFLEARDVASGLQVRSGNLFRLWTKDGQPSATSYGLVLPGHDRLDYACTVDVSNARLFDRSGNGSISLIDGKPVDVLFAGDPNAAVLVATSIYIRQPFATPTPDPNAPTSAPTPSPAPTLTPDPRPLIASWAIPYLSVGLAGTEAHPFGLDASLSDYRLEDGRTLHVEWQDLAIERATPTTFRVVRSFRIEGSEEVVATPDTAPFDDSAVLWNGTLLKLGKDATYESFVNAMGTPTTDETNDANGGKERILTYPDATVYLEYPESSVVHVSLDLASTAGRTPRGLQVGLTVSQVLALYGTGDFALVVSTEGAEVRSLAVYKKTGSTAYVYFSGSTATRIAFR